MMGDWNFRKLTSSVLTIEHHGHPAAQALAAGWNDANLAMVEDPLQHAHQHLFSALASVHF